MKNKQQTTNNKQQTTNKPMYILCTILLAAVFLQGCQKSGGEALKSAETVLTKVLGSTVQEADDFDAFLRSLAEADTKEKGSEPGISSISGPETFFQEIYGTLMTEECLEQILANRSCMQGMNLARQFDSDILVKDMELKKRSGEQDVFDFTASLVTFEDNKKAAQASGTVTMIKEDDDWLASYLTIKMQNE